MKLGAVLLAVGLIALAARAAGYVVLGGVEVGDAQPDSISYDLFARTMLSGWDWITAPLARREPLYPAFMALWYALPGSDNGWLHAGQLLLSTLTPVLVAWGLWPHVRLAVAGAAGVLIALNPHFVYFALLPLRETLVTFLVAGFIVTTVRWGFSGRRRAMAGSAACAILLAHTDVRFLPLAAVGPVLAMLCGGVRDRWRDTLPYVAIALLLMIPYQVRGYLAFHKPVVITERFLERWLPWAGIEIGEVQAFPDRASWLASWEDERRAGYDAMSEEERGVFDAGVRPSTSSAAIYRDRFLAYWQFLRVGRGYLPYPDGRFASTWSLSHNLMSTLVVLPFLLLLPLVPWRLPGPERRIALALASYLALHTALHVLVHARERYRIPLESLMAILAAMALVNLLSWWRSRRPRAGGAGIDAPRGV